MVEQSSVSGSLRSTRARSLSQTPCKALVQDACLTTYWYKFQMPLRRSQCNLRLTKHWAGCAREVTCNTRAWTKLKLPRDMEVPTLSIQGIQAIPSASGFSTPFKTFTFRTCPDWKPLENAPRLLAAPVACLRLKLAVRTSAYFCTDSLGNYEMVLYIYIDINRLI